MTIVRRAVLALTCTCLVAAAGGADDHKDRIDLERYAGQVLVVDFWASWCVPCRRSFPWLNAMQAKYESDGLVVLAVNEDSDWQEAARFLADYPAEFRVLHDRDGSIAKKFDLQAMPSTFVFDRNGELAHRHFGFRTRLEDDYEQALRTTLAVDATP